ncbi:hypothetical protein AURDEDRAFT_124577 [Auricularia subglabra TFB-10046 SS5]|nr:hypothetical protein AURDEDRAFT_124577 [Auricularia subglabra TFB-10046 SS5]
MSFTIACQVCSVPHTKWRGTADEFRDSSIEAIVDYFGSRLAHRSPESTDRTRLSFDFSTLDPQRDSLATRIECFLGKMLKNFQDYSRSDQTLELTLNLPEETGPEDVKQCLSHVAQRFSILCVLRLRLPTGMQWDEGLCRIFDDSAAPHLEDLSLDGAVPGVPNPETWHVFPPLWSQIAPNLKSLRLYNVVLPPFDAQEANAAQHGSVTELHYRIFHAMQLINLRATLGHCFPALEKVKLFLDHPDTKQDRDGADSEDKELQVLFGPTFRGEPRNVIQTNQDAQTPSGEQNRRSTVVQIYTPRDDVSPFVPLKDVAFAMSPVLGPDHVVHHQEYSVYSVLVSW